MTEKSLPSTPIEANGLTVAEDVSNRSSVSSYTSLDDPPQGSSKKRLRMLIIRHGQTDYNVKGIIQGQLDTDLNAVGRQEARYVAKTLQSQYIDEVYSSPLRRARDTATTIVQAHPKHNQGMLPFWLDDRLKERGFGSLEGHTFDRSKPKRDSIDGIEQMSTFASRLASFISDVIACPAPFKQSQINGLLDDKTTKEVTVTREANLFSIDKEEEEEEKKKEEEDPLSDLSKLSFTKSLNDLERGGCSRTIVIVAHGAAISALVGSVLMDTGMASLAAGVQRTRVWNCSIMEVIVEDVENLPRIKNKIDIEENEEDEEEEDIDEGLLPIDLTVLAEQCQNKDQKSKLNSNSSERSLRKPFMIERWADVRHLPLSSYNDTFKNDQQIAKSSADEMVGRATS